MLIKKWRGGKVAAQLSVVINLPFGKKIISTRCKEDIKDAYSDLKYPALIDKASFCVHFNVTNVIYAWALYYIGDYLNCAEVHVFLTIYENRRDNKVLKNATIESVIENIKSVDRLPQDEQTLAALREAGVSILQGPGAEMNTVYTSATLSELHQLLAAAKERNFYLQERQSRIHKEIFADT